MVVDSDTGYRGQGKGSPEKGELIISPIRNHGCSTGKGRPNRLISAQLLIHSAPP